MTENTCRAAVITEHATPLTLSDVPVPEDLEDGALLVDIVACSICGTDVHLWQGTLALRVDLPVILGHEMVGRVTDIGTGAEADSLGTPLTVGDRVVWSHANCGACHACVVLRMPPLCANRRSYMYENCSKPPYLLGGFAQKAYVLPNSGRVRVPDEVPSDWASIASCALRSVMNSFNGVPALKGIEHVVIQGSGPLGLLATAVAKRAGASRITVLGDPEERLTLAKRFGADTVISVTETSAAERAEAIRAQTGGRGADVVLEYTGNPRAFSEGLELLRAGGTYVVVGQLGQDTGTVVPSMITKKQINVVGSFSGDISHYWEALQFMARWRDEIDFGALITSQLRLDEVGEGLRRMQAMEDIKVLMTP